LQSAGHWQAKYENSIHWFPNTTFYAFRGIHANNNHVSVALALGRFPHSLIFFPHFCCLNFREHHRAQKIYQIWVIFSHLLLLQGAGVLFAAYRLIDKIVLLLYNGDIPRSHSSISSKSRDCFEFFNHGSRY